MKYLTEYKTYAILPKELRNISLLYHATTIDSFNNIIKNDILYGTTDYDFGIATSRNKHYNFGYNDNNLNKLYNQGEIQLILNKNKLKNKYKIIPFDWENWKSIKSKTGVYNNYHQTEDKIITDKIDNIKQYIIGIHISKNKYIQKVLNICKEYNFYPSYIFNENWQQININENYIHYEKPFDIINNHPIIELVDQESTVIAEFEFFNNYCIGFDYSNTLESYSVGHEISDSYNITDEYNFESFYNMIDDILTNYFCLVDISSNWFDFVKNIVPKYYNKEINRFKNIKKYNCDLIIKEYEREYRKKEKELKYNI